MKKVIPHALISASLVASLYAGEAISPTTPSADLGIGEQNWFGPPYLKFARANSDTDLPGYPVGVISYNHTFGGDFDSLPGEVGSDEFNLWTPIAPINFNDLHLFAFFNYNGRKYNTNGPENSLMLPESVLNSMSLPLIFIHDVSDKWMWGAMVMPTYAGSSSSSDNFTVSAGLGVGYNYNPNLAVFAGAYYAENYGDDYIIPGVNFVWRPCPKTEVFLLANTGGVSYSVNESLFLSLYGQYNSPSWYVKADASGPDRNVNMSSLKVGLKAETHFASVVWGYVAAGYSFMGELEVQDTDNHTIQKSDVDPSPFIECGLDVRF